MDALLRSSATGGTLAGAGECDRRPQRDALLLYRAQPVRTGSDAAEHLLLAQALLRDEEEDRDRSGLSQADHRTTGARRERLNRGQSLDARRERHVGWLASLRPLARGGCRPFRPRVSPIFASAGRPTICCSSAVERRHRACRPRLFHYQDHRARGDRACAASRDRNSLSD